VSFKLCPYVYRAVATMHFKKVDYKIIYIDLANKPDWFKKISPLGKVPILKFQNKGNWCLHFAGELLAIFLNLYLQFFSNQL